jgi:hypothetical protein
MASQQEEMVTIFEKDFKIKHREIGGIKTNRARLEESELRRNFEVRMGKRENRSIGEWQWIFGMVRL